MKYKNMLRLLLFAIITSYVVAFFFLLSCYLLSRYYEKSDILHELHKQNEFFMDTPGYAASGFIDFLIERFCKSRSFAYPTRYWLVCIYDNHTHLMIPQKNAWGRIIRVSSMWGPLVYRDAWPQLYIYRISILPSSRSNPKKLTINFISKSGNKSIDAFLESKNKISVYRSHVVIPKTYERRHLKIPCWCKWFWIGIICNSPTDNLEAVYFQNAPILYYWSHKCNGILVAAWLPQLVDMSKGLEGIVYYSVRSVRVNFRLNKIRYDGGKLVAFWGLPDALLQNCSCRKEALAYFTRGRAFEVKGDLRQAVADYTKAIELQPDYAEAYLRRGIVHLKLGEKEKARMDLKKVLEISKEPGLKTEAEKYLKSL